MSSLYSVSYIHTQKNTAISILHSDIHIKRYILSSSQSFVVFFSLVFSSDMSGFPNLGRDMTIPRITKRLFTKRLLF